MGSVLAFSSSPGHQNWPFSTEPAPSRWDAHPAHWDSPPRWERRDGRLPNPGSFHSLHRSCKGMYDKMQEPWLKHQAIRSTHAIVYSLQKALSADVASSLIVANLPPWGSCILSCARKRKIDARLNRVQFKLWSKSQEKLQNRHSWEKASIKPERSKEVCSRRIESVSVRAT